MLGSEHPSTATTYNGIAGVYKAMGDYDKALEYFKKVLPGFEKVLGPEHPEIQKHIRCLPGFMKKPVTQKTLLNTAEKRSIWNSVPQA